MSICFPFPFDRVQLQQNQTLQFVRHFAFDLTNSVIGGPEFNDSMFPSINFPELSHPVRILYIGPVVPENGVVGGGGKNRPPSQSYYGKTPVNREVRPEANCLADWFMKLTESDVPNYLR